MDSSTELAAKDLLDELMPSMPSQPSGSVQKSEAGAEASTEPEGDSAPVEEEGWIVLDEPSVTSHELDAWPGAFGAFKPSREAVGRSLSTMIWLYLILLAISLAISVLPKSVSSNTIIGVILNLTVDAISVLVVGAQIHTVIQSVRGNRVKLWESVTVASQLGVKLILLQLLVSISVVAGLLLLVVPGLIVISRLSMANYFLIDQKLGIMAAYKASWTATKGHSGKVWGIIIASGIMLLPLFTIIGAPVAFYLTIMYSAASALLYQYLLVRTNADNVL